jgi:hypothetical protein
MDEPDDDDTAVLMHDPAGSPVAPAPAGRHDDPDGSGHDGPAHASFALTTDEGFDVSVRAHGADADGATGPGGATRRRLVRRGVGIGAAGTLAAVLVLALLANLMFGARLTGREARRATTADALAEFRSEAEAGGIDEALPDELLATDPLADDATVPDGSGPADTPVPDAAADGGGTAAPGGNPSGAAATPVLRPRAGVYTFAARGFEEASLPRVRRPMPPTVSAIVTHDGGCWNFKLTIFAEHVETIRYCTPAPGALNQPRREVTLTFPFLGIPQTVRSIVNCTAQDLVRPAMAPGARWDSACVMQNTGADTNRQTESGPTIFVGFENVTIGGQTVRAYRVKTDHVMTGGQSGPVAEELWISAVDGTLLRIDRNKRLTGQTVLGANTYTEQNSFTLQSLAPRT